MSLLRASPSPSPSPIPSLSSSPNVQYLLNRTMTAISSVLRKSVPQHNVSSEELTMILGDPNPSEVRSFTSQEVYNILTFVAVFSAIGFAFFMIVTMLFENKITQFQKQKMLIHTPINWIKNKYAEYTGKEVLPVYRPKKAKESPFVSSMPLPQILPQCPRLEGAEKGQNLMFKLSVPYRRFQSSENLPAEAEHRITITTTVEQTNQTPKI